MAEAGYRVLVVDLDPQGNASTGLGIGHGGREVTIYEVLAAEAPMADAVIPTPVENLFVVPSTIDLAGAEIELVSQFSREQRLHKAIEPLLGDGYDFVFLDCPPSLGLLTVNALTAASEVLVPIQCEYYALEGLGQLLRNVKLVQQNVNPSLHLTGIVLTMFDSRTRLSEQVVAEVRRYFGDRVYETVIPRSVRLSEAPGFGQPITVYDSRSRGAESYRELALEVVSRLPADEPFPAFEDLPVAIAQVPEKRPMSAPRPLVVEPEEVEPEEEASEAEEQALEAEEEVAGVEEAPVTTEELTASGEIGPGETAPTAAWVEMLEPEAAAKGDVATRRGEGVGVGDPSMGPQGVGLSAVEGSGDVGVGEATAPESQPEEPSAPPESADATASERPELTPRSDRPKRRWMWLFRRGGRR